MWYLQICPKNIYSLFESTTPTSLVEFISDLLKYDPGSRLTSQECLQHPYFAAQPLHMLFAHATAEWEPKTKKAVDLCGCRVVSLTCKMLSGVVQSGVVHIDKIVIKRLLGWAIKTVRKKTQHRYRRNLTQSMGLQPKNPKLTQSSSLAISSMCRNWSDILGRCRWPLHKIHRWRLFLERPPSRHSSENL